MMKVPGLPCSKRLWAETPWWCRRCWSTVPTFAFGAAPGVRHPCTSPVSVMTTGYAKGTATGVAQLLLDQGVDIHAQDNEGRTPLHLAVTYDAEDDVFRELVAMLGSERPPVGATDMVEFLLDQGADIEALSNDRETPLLAAAAGSRTPDVVRLLLSRGSDVGAYNSRGESACQAASRMGWLVDTDVMPELLRRVRDFGSPTTSGTTPP